MSDWGPVFVAVVLFILLTQGLLIQHQYPDSRLLTKSTAYLIVPAGEESGFLTRWTARGTNVRPRVWRRPKLMDDREVSDVVNLDTAETRPSMVSSSTCIALESSSFL
ncbi:hypothetical protein Vadar_009189 [Vaccinium darrowii]|uniref:Uncharacterized protein n=1 Tax=Vaccinium darrowii TaxID=229202 RepID=A0ACB7YDP4_9ERIC|nr:hypothetical protein Vadar_009189 [Vaccinium darrowii]